MKRLLISLMMFAVAAQADPAARFCGSGKADPVRVENLRERNSPVAETRLISFDLAWDHSWRAAWEEPAERHGGDGPLKLESWDAAWVFVKFRKPGDDGWSHASLSLDAADHVVPTGAKLDVGPSDDGKRGLGVFIYRAKVGSGANHWKDVKLAWQNLADGVESSADVELKVFAIQMVYVPQGAYWLGDGSKSSIPAGQFSAGDTDAPFRIEGEDAIVLGGEDQEKLGNRDGLGMERAEDFTSSGAQTLPASFPKGYEAFYCMRNEITEGQFVDCINTLDAVRQQHLKPFEGSRTGIVLVASAKDGKPAVYGSDQPHVACSLLWIDCGLYAAWAGLRPMTELEFEKACRGPLNPVANEYAWGTAVIAGKDFDKLFPDPTHPGYVVRNPGQPDESLTLQGDYTFDARRGNAAWYGAIRRTGPSGRHGQIAEDAIVRPLRPGIFANPASGRVEAGASYWGILDLSGNLWERVMTVGNPYGRRFAGAHGAWPIETDPERFGMGTGIRGGSFTSWLSEVSEPPKESRRLRVSDREKVGRNTPISREWNRSRAGNFGIGFRCVRTAEIRQQPAVPPTDQAAPHARAPALDRHSTAGGKTLRNVADWLDWKVEIENLAVARRDEKTAVLTFDITWKDSWRDRHNHDAAWLFFKLRAAGKAEWKHVRLAADRVLNPTGYGQAEGGTRVEFLVPDGDDGFAGLFVRRVEDGEGALVAKKVSVVCELPGDLTGISIRPFGIRMVYVPEGPYHLGSGGLEPGGFYRYSDGRQHIEPYEVTGPGAIPTGREAGRLWARKYGSPPEDGGSIPAEFPNGFAAFYCMKHQIAPAQYAAFLNTLDAKQADERYAGAERWIFDLKNGKSAGKSRVHYSGGQGQVLRPSTELRAGATTGYASKSAGPRAGPGCFGLSWADGASFAAWAGLRPMTELELEKAVRGFREPMPDEVGPSYWGIGGFNTWDWNAFKGDPQSERAVTVGNPAGRRFRGTHGLGTLTLPADWPQADAIGSGMRCTHYMPGVAPFKHNWNLQRVRLADRFLAAVADPQRNPSHKWRGVRTAPRIEKSQANQLVGDKSGRLTRKICKDANPYLVRAPDPKLEKEFDYLVYDLGNGVELKLVRVPAKGRTFAVGASAKEQDEVTTKYFDGKRPASLEFEVEEKVTLTDDFYIGQCEVTRGQFRRFVEDAGYTTETEATDGGYGWNEELKKFEGRDRKYTWKNYGVSSETDEHPVTNITRNDARKFCEWLAKKGDGKVRLREVRLPGEAEWEFACRAGSSNRFSFGDEDERLTEFANVADGTWAETFAKSSAIQTKDGHAFSSPVGQFTPNAFGLYDMHGNVWEWVEDYYGKYSALPKERNAIQTVDQGQRRPVMRGGAWYVGPSGCRAANRWLVGIGGRYGSGGFRVVCMP